MNLPIEQDTEVNRIYKNLLVSVHKFGQDTYSNSTVESGANVYPRVLLRKGVRSMNHNPARKGVRSMNYNPARRV